MLFMTEALIVFIKGKSKYCNLFCSKIINIIDFIVTEI